MNKDGIRALVNEILEDWYSAQTELGYHYDTTPNATINDAERTRTEWLAKLEKLLEDTVCT